ncbi:MAG: class I SAM-dependent methyltransferase [Pirellulales bacterium]|nr:class I SAM-dependent methyltransferase [Pirellulales bacterium]
MQPFQNPGKNIDRRTSSLTTAEAGQIGVKARFEAALQDRRRSKAKPRSIAALEQIWKGPAIGLRIDGRSFQLGKGKPAATIVVPSLQMLAAASLSPLVFGEAYARGEIEIDGSLARLMEAYHRTNPEQILSWKWRLFSWLSQHLPRAISTRSAAANVHHHYDLGNDFYRRWLDPSLTYSCAYFLRDSDDLAVAQRQKLELLCRKARLQPGQTLLDIGCGWGSLLVHAAEHYRVQVVGISLSEKQVEYVESLVKRHGLQGQIRVLKADWRQLDGAFDRIISVGMFEHVGKKQYGEFFRQWQRLLAPGGLSILHCIGRMTPAPTDAWIDKYIFPGGYLPALWEIAQCAADAGLYVLDVENLRKHYAQTIACWIANYHAAATEIIRRRGREFFRTWSLYLHASEAGFRYGKMELWQTVLARDLDHAWPLNRELAMDVSGSVADLDGLHASPSTKGCDGDNENAAWNGIDSVRQTFGYGPR